MIHVRPVAKEHFRLQRAAVHHFAFSAVQGLDRREKASVKSHVNESRPWIERHAYAVIAQVESIVLALHAAHSDVHPLRGPVGGIVNTMRPSHAAGRSAAVRPSIVNCASLSRMTNISSIWL